MCSYLDGLDHFSFLKHTFFISNGTTCLILDLKTVNLFFSFAALTDNFIGRRSFSQRFLFCFFFLILVILVVFSVCHLFLVLKSKLKK